MCELKTRRTKLKLTKEQKDYLTNKYPDKDIAEGMRIVNQHFRMIDDVLFNFVKIINRAQKEKLYLDTSVKFMMTTVFLEFKWISGLRRDDLSLTINSLEINVFSDVKKTDCVYHEEFIGEHLTVNVKILNELIAQYLRM